MPASAVIKEARERWNRCAEAEDKRRKQIVLAKEFRATKQWPDEIAIQRQGGAALQGQAAQPPRPMITVDRLSQPIRQVSNAIRSANYGIDILPNGEGADEETAKIFKGYIRRIQNAARTEDPIPWAADQAVEGGIGWFRLATQYLDKLGQTADASVFDQELVLGRITNNLAVYCDPAAVKPTRGDMRFAFVTEDVMKDDFKRQWPKADFTGLEGFTSEGDNSKWKDWVSADMVRVAEYWTVTDETQVVALLTNGQIVQDDQIPEDESLIRQKRELKIPRVKMQKINAVEVLEEFDWLGTRIPLFPILGEELNVDGEVILRGIIAAAMDPQRMLNFSYSAVVEMFALSTKAPWVVAEGQTEGFEDIWQQANRYNYSFLPYKPTSLAGAMVPPPQRQTAEPPIQAAVEMCKIFEDAIKATTAIYDPGLGNISAQEKSGRAILALQQQGELTQSHFSANVMCAYLDVAQEMVHIIPQITRPGQILQILGIDDAPEQVMVGQPYQMQGGTPVPAPGVTPEMVQMQKGLAKFYDLKQGRYAVTVNVGKAYTTRKSEGAAMIGDFIEKSPQLLNLLGDIFFRDLDFPGSEEISERMKKLLPPQLQQGQEGEPNPQMLMQRQQQLQQMLKMTTDELNAKNHLIETEQVKAQQELQKVKLTKDADFATTKLEWDKKIELELIKAQASVEVAELNNKIEAQGADMAALREAFLQILGQSHEAVTQGREQAHDVATQLLQQQHEKDMAATQQQHEQGLAQQQAAAQAQQAAQQPEQPA